MQTTFRNSQITPKEGTISKMKEELGESFTEKLTKDLQTRLKTDEDFLEMNHKYPNSEQLAKRE